MGHTISNLTKNFENRYILENFSYNFDDRGIYLLRGKSGAGKTTLLRMIAGLDRDYSGRINFNGSVAYAFQEHRLFPWLNSISNATVSLFDIDKVKRNEVASSMLSKFGLSEDEMLLYPRQLSGGMRQRVSLARAFISRSEVLLLDEPTKELDSELVSVVLQIIREKSNDRLVIVSTHDDLESELDIKGTIVL